MSSAFKVQVELESVSALNMKDAKRQIPSPENNYKYALVTNKCFLTSYLGCMILKCMFFKFYS